MSHQSISAYLKLTVFVCLCAIITLGCPIAGGNHIVYVNTPATKIAQDGTSWVRAFAEIQDGIDAADAAGGGEVWVARGVYAEQRPNDPDGSLVMKSGVNLYGGFIGIELARNARDWENNKTIIDGTNGLVTKAVSNAYHVIKGADYATLDGFLVTGGDGIGASPGDQGGGMYNNSASPTVRNCTFFDNYAVTGGAMYNENSSPAISNCRFEKNIAPTFSGAIHNEASSPAITECLFIYNLGHAEGGAMSNLNGSSPTITNCRFLYNQAAGLAGVILNNDSSPVITNCVFAFSLAYGAGGVMENEASTITITNCTFYGNYVAGGAAAIADDGFGTTIINSIFWDNQSGDIPSDIEGAVDITYSCTETGIAGTGNISADPKFVDPLNADFRLIGGSPCVDTGTDTGAPAEDIRGITRPLGAGVDMGAFEWALLLGGF